MSTQPKGSISVSVLACVCVACLLQDGGPTRAQEPGPRGDTVRLLEQATFGPTRALIAQVSASGIDAFLNEQFAAGVTPYPELPPMPTTRPPSCVGECQRDHYTMHPLQVHFFMNALYGSDQLRQRMAFALSQILVVSGRAVTLSSWMRPYTQLLYGGALGNYRQLLYDLTRNAAMGEFLDMVDNRCQTRVPAAPTVCRAGRPVKPNENYARELLQLFTIGTDLLNPDGSSRLDPQGVAVPAYDQAIVEEFARVFTGWIFAPQFDAGVPNYLDPMRVRRDAQGREDYHDYGAKTLLNTVTLPAGQGTDEDLNAALDNLVTHRNLAPFISKQLIQHLVTSNPSPAYVSDVAAVFAANTASPTQLQEVARAILLHPEARGDVKTDERYGKLREPVQFMTNVLRAFNATSDGVLNTLLVNNSPIGAADMSQDVFRPGSVFSFYPPDYQVPGTDPPLLGPPFQLQSSVTALRRINFVNQVVFSSIPRALPNRPLGTSIDLTPLVAIAHDTNRLIAELDVLLLHGSMSPEMRTVVFDAIAKISVSNPPLRARQAVYLVLTSSQYQVER